LEILKDASLEMQVRILVVIEEFTSFGMSIHFLVTKKITNEIEQGLIELHRINFFDELLTLPIGLPHNRIYSTPINDILFQLIDYRMSIIDPLIISFSIS
jgi:hypothetical protein